ncbi:MAG: ABC transporter ATP-binding protein [Actinomycetota bacterium]|nr:ABC transporter ATP-binding protein [Actinomycetota bacterium]
MSEAEAPSPPPAPAQGESLVSLHGIVKDFPRVRANDRVDFELRAGEIHALLGENGAGKTTLMNILAGLYRADSGEIAVHGERVDLRSPRDAIDRGIGMVHQHFRLVDRFTVAENVTLGWRSPRTIIRRRALDAEIAGLAEEYRMRVDPARPVWQLSVGEQQRVEILKNLYRGADVLILDEPTAVLTPQEAAGLFESLRRMAAGGRGVVFITHKLDEVMAVADRITVLRRGRNVATVAKGGTSERELARMMIGHELPAARAEGDVEPGELILALEGLEADDDRGLPALAGVDLAVSAGEIVGVAGVAGNGQRELAEAIVGLRPARRGRVLLRGRDVTHASVARRVASGVGYCPEDRLRQGVAPGLSVAENLISKRYRTAPVGGRFLLHRRAARRAAAELATSFDIRGADLDAPAASLSGGNLQKVVLAREISADPVLLIAAQPTRGLDVGAAHFTRRLLLEQRARGRAVLVISEDLDELLELSDRVAVMYEGRIDAVIPAREADEERIGLLMAGRG